MFPLRGGWPWSRIHSDFNSVVVIPCRARTVSLRLLDAPAPNNVLGGHICEPSAFSWGNRYFRDFRRPIALGYKRGSQIKGVQEVIRLVSPTAFSSGVSASPQLKFAIAWATFGLIVPPTAILMTIGVLESIALPIMTIAIVPFQYVAYCLISSRDNPTLAARNQCIGEILERHDSDLVQGSFHLEMNRVSPGLFWSNSGAHLEKANSLPTRTLQFQRKGSILHVGGFSFYGPRQHNYADLADAIT